MAQIVDNKKNFKVIQCNLQEVLKFGGMGICDTCGSPSFDGYYVAVLNRWLCSKCYHEWLERATNYPEDKQIEEKNFNFYKNILIQEEDSLEPCVLCGKKTKVLKTTPIPQRGQYVECCGQLCLDCFKELKNQ